jgi:hypothetical protein
MQLRAFMGPASRDSGVFALSAKNRHLKSNPANRPALKPFPLDREASSALYRLGMLHLSVPLLASVTANLVSLRTRFRSEPAATAKCAGDRIF